MAPRKTRRPGQGFSLYDLQDDIATVVETLGDALSRQGVPVDRDSLLLSIQSVVKTIGMGSQPVDYGYSALASDNTEVPYSVAGDLLCIAFEYFQQGDKKASVKNMLTAMESEDFEQISQGLLEMNRLSSKTNKSVFANDDEDEDNDTEDDDNTDDENEDKEDTTDDESDLSDEEIDELVEDSERDVTADDEEANEPDTSSNANTEQKPKESSVSDEEESEEEESNEGNREEQPKKLEASHTSRVLANRLSLEGHSEGRKRAFDFVKKHSRL